MFGHDDLAASYGRPLPSLHSSEADLTIYGVYTDWNTELWRVVGATYYVDVKLDQATRNESFISGYLQIERQLPKQFTIFGRSEASARMQESRYIALFDEHDGNIDIALHRQALGLRWDYARRQALTLELAHVISLSQRANEVRVQWSAAIP